MMGLGAAGWDYSANSGRSDLIFQEHRISKCAAHIQGYEANSYDREETSEVLLIDQVRFINVTLGLAA
jgi:hypothetical protein